MNHLKTRVAVLISGRGSNMQALLEASRAADYPATIGLVLADHATAPGLDIARAAGVRAEALPRHDFASRPAFEAALEARIAEAGTELVCLAGFMRLLGADFVGRWSGRMINIHPSLLPAFRGLETHERALAAGVRIHGCTVHFVVPEVDTGPIVAQAAVAVRPDDTAPSLAGRVLAQEHRLYPAALALVASGRARLEDGRVILEASVDASAALTCPELPTSLGQPTISLPEKN